MDDEETIDLQTIAAHERTIPGHNWIGDAIKADHDVAKEEEKAAEAEPPGIVAVSLDGEPVPNSAASEALNTRRAKQRRKK